MLPLPLKLMCPSPHMHRSSQRRSMPCVHMIAPDLWALITLSPHVLHIMGTYMFVHVCEVASVMSNSLQSYGR